MITVLVAEDNPENRKLIEDTLQSNGYRLLYARDGHETLAVARAQNPDLLLLDINMPGINGFEVCAQLKADPATAQMPILMITALSDIEDRVRGLGLGAEDYITKPFSPRELLARVEAHLRIKTRTDQLAATQAQIRRMFERFVTPQVVQKLLQNPDQVKLGGHLQEVTILFADLEGFSAVAERAAPDRLLEALNRYHSLLVEHIQREEGTVDKFLGDGIMALYNTPLAQADHALRAVRTAINIRQALPAFQQQFDPIFRLEVNFGIHTGEAIVGQVGTAELMEYTAIGDAVNLASRLQSLSAHGQIMISRATYERIKGGVVVQSLGTQAIKGRETTVELFEVLELSP